MQTPTVREDYLPFGRPNFSEEEIEAVTRVMRSGWVGMGPETIAFEKELAEALGAPHVVTVSSCTSALTLSLAVLGVGPGDEVICPSLTWCATANAALYLGATPVLCDVDPQTLCVTPETVEARLTPRTRAVVPVHMGGLAADICGMRAVLPPSVHIVEDAAHAFGARFPGGLPVGASGNLTCFSFYANKNLSTGEGGAIALADSHLADRLRSLRQNALPVDAWKRFTHAKAFLTGEIAELGYKANYTDLQACIGRVQLRRQGEFHAIRHRIASYYHAALSAAIPSMGFQAGVLDDAHSLHLFLVLVPGGADETNRDDLLVALRSRNVGATVHYTPLHLMPLYRTAAGESLVHTDEAARRILTLPISASMSMDDARYVVEHTVNAWESLGKNRSALPEATAAGQELVSSRA
jgi:perosamine synthetase